MTNRICLSCGRAGPWPQPRGTQGVRCPACKAAYRRAKGRAYQDPGYLATPRFGVCHLCGRPGADTRDHIVPLSKGGTNAPSNLKPAHRACNSGKRDRR